MEKNPRRILLSWLSVGVLLVLCGILGVLQYRWIGEVSLAERERLRGSLQASLGRLSRDFNSEISTACRALVPAEAQPDGEAAEKEVAARFAEWHKTGRQGRMFSRIAIVELRARTPVLRNLDMETGLFRPADWPAAWDGIRERLEFRLSPEPWQRRGSRGLPVVEDGLVFELPLFEMPPPGSLLPSPGTPLPSSGAPPPSPGAPFPFGRRGSRALIFELNLEYVREVVLPELLQRHLDTGGGLEYQVEVVTRANPPAVIFGSDPGETGPIAANADASVGLFELQYDQIFPRVGPPGARGRGPGRGPGDDAGRWRMFVRHRAGSLEAVVAHARWRNLAVTAGVLMLMAASAGALVRYTRRAQKLAALQMEFVAGVSHELRTPLTVIHTAAHNLRGVVANNPSQVERYGALIQQESGRLRELVEQVLNFAGAQAGRAVQAREALSVETLIEESLASSKAAIQEARCVVEKNIEAGLPRILGDPLALKHVLENLIGNAAKYGSAEGHWIGVFGSKAGDGGPAVEIRVADHGPGIPEDERERVFEPFFRGRRAVQDQIHGAGLGLNLAKKIVEAHGGSIRLNEAAAQGAEFIVRIPAAPAGAAT
jgi:signal transduction histidine kinase